MAEKEENGKELVLGETKETERVYDSGKDEVGSSDEPKDDKRSNRTGLVALGVAGALLVGGLYALGARPHKLVAAPFNWVDRAKPNKELYNGVFDGRKVEYEEVRWFTQKDHVMTEWRNSDDFYELWDHDATPLNEFANLEKVVFERDGESFVFERDGSAFYVNGEKVKDFAERDSVANIFEKADNRYNYNRFRISGADTKAGEGYTSRVYDAFAGRIPEVPQEFIDSVKKE